MYKQNVTFSYYKQSVKVYGVESLQFPVSLDYAIK